MREKKKNDSNNELHRALRSRFVIVLRVYPAFSIVFGLMLWAFIDNGISYSLIMIVPAIVLCMHLLITYRSFFKFARHTNLINALGETYLVYCFLAMASTCIFRLFGINGLVVGVIAIAITSVVIVIKCTKYWNDVWESHRENNENSVLDLVNARYDYLNPFNMDEHKVKKKSGKQDSNLAIPTIISICAPIGASIGLMLSGKSQIMDVLVVGGSLTFGLYVLKSVSHSFFLYRKLAYYEKKIGKQIINGTV